VLYELSAGVAAARSQQRSTALRPFEDFIRGEDAAIVIDDKDTALNSSNSANGRIWGNALTWAIL